ncbi:hypothetical protein SRB5_38490 [Streptomyces sp. RB5]|uniref:DUF58 domain-containing protein n=1 Tax=Streptomyces smaragdinus TaxID=2585196 RepID=A0A7K0CJN4_9ACTN|nr:DUF58 domain-containing protein [Streptomyces smaragdinus]MQY13699.1 hypothetical protein [Streptomyces smaragdinus]
MSGWRAGPLVRWCLLPAVTALVLAALLRRADLAVVAAPLLWWLAFGSGAAAGPAGEATLGAAALRTVEGEDFEVTVEVRFAAPVRLTRCVLELPRDVGLVRPPELPGEPVASAVLRWEVRALRWGRTVVGPVRVRASAAAGLRVTELRTGPLRLAVLPEPEPVEAALVPAVLPRRIGEHPAPVPGEGTEFEAIRPFQPGDRPRRVNWAVSARRRAPYVTVRQEERSYDVVLVLDTLQRAGAFGRDSLDLSVRGASGLAAAHLARGERVGLVAAGGRVRGVAPGVGGHQLQRIAEAVLDLRVEGAADESVVDRLPRTVLPSGALVVYFTPLLDERARLTALDLRRRGHPLVVVDVLTAEPGGSGPRPAGRGPSAWREAGRSAGVRALTLRLWRLDRAADLYEIGRWGVPVIRWDGTEPLRSALGAAARRPVVGRWRR